MWEKPSKSYYFFVYHRVVQIKAHFHKVERLFEATSALASVLSGITYDPDTDTTIFCNSKELFSYGLKVEAVTIICAQIVIRRRCESEIHILIRHSCHGI